MGVMHYIVSRGLEVTRISLNEIEVEKGDAHLR